jgi:hypothetical protein
MGDLRGTIVEDLELQIFGPLCETCAHNGGKESGLPLATKLIATKGRYCAGSESGTKRIWPDWSVPKKYPQPSLAFWSKVP